MAELRFGISKTDHEWKALENIIKEKKSNTPLKGSGINHFLRREINRLFKGQKKNCPESRAVRTCKEFQMTVDDAIEEQIRCEANELGISIGELIAKKIVDRHLDLPAIALPTP